MLLMNLGGNNGVTEYTRNELRAFVGVRSQQGSTRLTNQLLPGQNVTPGELDPLSLNFDMSPTGIMKSKNTQYVYSVKFKSLLSSFI